MCVYGEGLLTGKRIVVPHSFSGRVLELANVGHQGVVNRKYRLRSNVWWLKIEADGEGKCKICHGCQGVSDFRAPEPMSRVVSSS